MNSRLYFRAIHRQQEAGQAIVEFVLVVFFVFILFVSLLQFILIMYAYNTLANAAKEGIRYAIVHGTGNTQCSGPGNPSVTPAITCPDGPGNNVKTAVTNFAGLSLQNIPPSNVTVSYNPNSANPAACSAPGCLVRVQVRHTYNPFFGLGWPRITLFAAADGRIMN